MPSIRILPERVANQIAAGEVVERPAAAIKELVENALDAGATRITVEFQHGGRSRMRVEDDGQGMGRDDALLAFERHATSKIVETSDLDRLATFGFRGEALPSIASVSRCTLQTRPRGGGAGTEILVNGGKFVHVRDCGRPVGTSVEVADLFHAVPARRKFLKTDRTEAAHIVQGMRLYALAYPRVAFTLLEDGRAVFRSPACETLEERVGEILGPQLAEDLIAIDSAEAGLRLRGLIGRPGAGRASRHETITFVNGRPVDSRTLNYALLESYQGSVPKGRYPPAIVFLECDPSAVDVNVHPTKREIRFRDESAVRGFIIRSVGQRLREFGGEKRPETALAPERRAEPEAPAPFLRPEGRVEESGMDPVRQSPPLPPPPPVSAPKGPAWRFLGLAHGNTAIFETAAGLVLLDRRAAHERIWFERLRAEFRAGGAPVQRLLLPARLELDPIAAALLLDRRALLQACGFEVAEFGRNFFRIESLPAWMEPADAEPFLRDLLGAFREGRLAGANLDLAREELARLAASRAVRLPVAAGPAEMTRLIAELFATSAPLTSPAGRPTCVEIGHGELARKFQK